MGQTTKVNLSMCGEHILPGYLNLSRYTPLTGDAIAAPDIVGLDDFVDDAECDEIVASDILDYLPREERESAVREWCKKLRHGGKLTIGGVDLASISRCLFIRTLSYDDASKLIYGSGLNPMMMRTSVWAPEQVYAIMESLKLKIANKTLENHMYLITGARS